MDLIELMIASLDQLGCYSNLQEWTGPSNSSSHLEKLTPLQIDLLASAVENLATAIVTVGLVEHITYTQYMYSSQIGLAFRNPLTNLANLSSARLSSSQSNFLPGVYERLVAARNRIDKFFLDEAKTLFANRFTIHLRSDSILSRILRFHLRHLQPNCLLNDPDLENKITQYLHQFFKLEVEKNQSAWFLSNCLWIFLPCSCYFSLWNTINHFYIHSLFFLTTNKTNIFFTFVYLRFDARFK